MDHPLQELMRKSDGFVVIGDSSEGRFPGQSYHCYTQVQKRFYCVDLGGMTESRGFTKGGKVYPSIEDLPDDHGDLAIVWMKPHSAVRGVEAAHAAGCKQIWFSFQTGHRDAVARAKELGMTVVEIGRCPVYYLDDMVLACRAHTVAVKLSGSWKKPPQLDPDAKRRELW